MAADLLTIADRISQAVAGILIATQELGLLVRELKREADASERETPGPP